MAVARARLAPLGVALMLLSLLAGLERVAAAVHRYHGEKFFAVGDAYVFRGGREGLFARGNVAKNDEEAAAKAAVARAGEDVDTGNTFIRFSKVRSKDTSHFACEECDEPLCRARSNTPCNGASDTPLAPPPLLWKVHFHRSSALTADYHEGRVTNGKQTYVGMVQAVVFEVGDRDLIGHVTDGGAGSRRFCCTPTLQAQTGCESDRLIIKDRGDGSGFPWVTDIYFEDNATVAYAVDDAVVIDETGMYYLWFVVCDPNLSGIQIDGQTTWKNPHGYLPGMMAPNLALFKWMSIAYGALALLWFLAYAVSWKHVLMLQHCISAVIFLSLVEMAAWYFDFASFNMTGLRPEGITVFAVLTGAARKSVSRLLVLVVSMGYGVVKPTLGGISQQVLSLTGFYFVGTAALDVMTNVGTVDDLDSSLRVILVLPVAVLDAVYILWIFVSLSRTLAQLQARRQSAKLDMYRKFTNALALMVMVSIVFICYEMFFKISDRYNERWQEDWIPNAFWHALSFALLLVICVLWAPHATSLKYAYHEDDVAEVWEESDAITENFGDDAGKAIASEVFALDDEETQAGAKLE